MGMGLVGTGLATRLHKDCLKRSINSIDIHFFRLLKLLYLNVATGVVF